MKVQNSSAKTFALEISEYPPPKPFFIVFSFKERQITYAILFGNMLHLQIFGFVNFGTKLNPKRFVPSLFFLLFKARKNFI